MDFVHYQQQCHCINWFCPLTEFPAQWTKAIISSQDIELSLARCQKICINLLWRQTEPPQHPKESTAWNIKILNPKSYALVKYNLHSKWTAARCCQRFPSIFASIFPNSEDISKVDACIQQDYRIDLITWYDMQWPNNSLKQNCPQSLCLAFCCCGPDSADRCWWHLFLTGVPSGTTTVSDVPHFIKFHKDNAFVSLTLQHS